MTGNTLRKHAGGRPRNDDRERVDVILTGVWLFRGDLNALIHVAADRLVTQNEAVVAEGKSRSTLTPSAARRRLNKAVTTELAASGCGPLSDGAFRDGVGTDYLYYVLARRGAHAFCKLASSWLAIALVPEPDLRAAITRERRLDPALARECLDFAERYLAEQLTGILEDVKRSAETP
jgi:hypothetical protein